MKKKITTITTTEIEDGAFDKKTYLALVLDESGSMGAVKDDTIGGFNTVIDGIAELADLGGETFVSLFTFNSSPKVKLLNASAKQLAKLTNKSYQPGGNTAMLDAIGLALSSLEEYDTAEGNVAFKVTILTDGVENASREYTGPVIAQKIKKLEATGRWSIELIGANVDIAKLRAQTGIGQTFSYRSDDIGTRNVFDSYNASNAAYFANRSMGAQQFDSFGGAAAAASLGQEVNLSSPEMVKAMQEEAQRLMAEQSAKRKAAFDKMDQKAKAEKPILV